MIFVKWTFTVLNVPSYLLTTACVKFHVTTCSVIRSRAAGRMLRPKLCRTGLFALQNDSKSVSNSIKSDPWNDLPFLESITLTQALSMHHY
jgi:hypothetical protein